MNNNHNFSLSMPTTNQIVGEEFMEAGSFIDYLNGDAKCLPCKPGVYVITCDEQLDFDKNLFPNDIERKKLINHIGKILYIGSSGNLNYRVCQLINNGGHIAGPKFRAINKKEWNKIHIKYIESENKESAKNYEKYLIVMYGSNNYKKIDDYSQTYEYPPFNSKV